MNPRDDNQDMRSARDEAAIAGRVVASDDAALAEVLGSLRASAQHQAPPPSEALQVLLTHGRDPADAVQPADGDLGVPGPDAPPAVLEIDAARSRRRRLTTRYVVGAGIAATFALGGTAAAAAVQDGVPLSEVPGVIGRQISGTVGDALEAIGLRPAAGPDSVPGSDPSQGTSRNERPNPSESEPGRSGEEQGRSGDAPASPGTTTGPTAAPGRSDEAPGRPDPIPVPAPRPTPMPMPMQGGGQPGGSDQAPIPGGGVPGGPGSSNVGSDGAATSTPGPSPGSVVRP